MSDIKTAETETRGWLRTKMSDNPFWTFGIGAGVGFFLSSLFDYVISQI